MADSTSSWKQDRFLRGLACAALSPGLRSVLVADLAPAELLPVAALLAQMLEAAGGGPVVFVLLGTTETEDDLWGSWALRAGAEDRLVVRQPGLLTGSRDDTRLRLVVIPDLNRLSLAAARAGIALMGADVAHLERHGQRRRWRPNLCWLAGRRTTERGGLSAELGRVSPHLLDRFALRLAGHPVTPTDRPANLLAWLRDPVAAEREQTRLTSEAAADLRQAAAHWPSFTPKAQTRLADYLARTDALTGSHGPRRSIALARLACAHARLGRAPEVAAEHVDQAAEVIGLEPIAKPSAQPQPQPAPVTPPDDRKKPPEVPPGPLTQPSAPQVPEPRAPLDEPGPGGAAVPPEPELFPSVAVPAGPYVEDRVKVEREAVSLRLPLTGGRAVDSTRGPILGIRRATNLQDLAVVSTLLEAAKFQAVRRLFSPAPDGRLLISPTDLRSYRRAPVTEHMLVLLLDHTSLGECRWVDALMPYLRWAYVERAGVCLVQVGEAEAPNPYQATRTVAPSLLVPRVLNALRTGPGEATPLAHGLELALMTLQHALQHKRATLRQVQFVVLTDGRGNVPLQDSRDARKPERPVTREGIDDALEAARPFRELKNVWTVFLNPQPRHHAELPLALAEALRVAATDIPRHTGEET